MKTMKTMKTKRFDRHEHMSSTTRGLILDTINNIKFFDDTDSLENMLYGLYDGYNYSEEIHEEANRLADSQTIKFSVFLDIISICNTVNEYPEVIYTSKQTI